MALLQDRVIIETDIYHTCPTATQRGVVLTEGTSGSGVGIGDSAGVADFPGGSTSASPSGYRVAGLLLNDMVNIDLTRYHLNFQKDEVQVGNRCTLLRKGRVTTNAIAGGVTPVVGDAAYLTTAGNLTNTKSTTGGLAATPKVGEFRTGLDENGYATVDVQLPNTVNTDVKP